MHTIPATWPNAREWAVDVFENIYEEVKTWRNVEFCGLELPLAEYNAMTAEERSALESESKQLIEDFTKEEVLDFFEVHAPVFLHHEDADENTSDNLTYIAIR